jgi:hypothetical protein
MADVRSLLRQERAARQQAKPPKRSAAPAAAPVSRKRKAADDEMEERKRTRTEEEAGVPAGFFDAGTENEDSSLPIDASHTVTDAAIHADQTSPALEVSTLQAPRTAANDAELDAFLHEMDQEAEAQRNAAQLYSGAVIEAAPMTAAELAAQAREDMSAQRAKRDEEMEGEKEDAARALEDEFDEMEGLEERIKRLREQREALRNKHVVAKADNVVAAISQPVDEESDSEEDWDDWNFRPS